MLFVRLSSASGCVVVRAASSSRIATRACVLIRDASIRMALTTTTTITTTTNPMIRPAHQPPRCGSPYSFNVTPNPRGMSGTQSSPERGRFTMKFVIVFLRSAKLR